MKISFASRSKWGLFFAVYLSLSLHFSLQAMESLDFLQHRAWTIDDGLPMNTVSSVVQSAEGYLWLGTEAGIARFDGVRFETFSHENTPTFSSNVILQLLMDKKGTLWIATRGGGLLVHRDGEFHRVEDPGGILSNDIWCLIECQDNSVWVGHRNGLVRVINGRMQAVPLPGNVSNRVVNCLLEDRAGRIWVGTKGGDLILIRKRGDIFQSEYLGSPGLVITALYQDRQDNIWVGTFQNGLHRFDNSGRTRFTVKNGLTHMDVQSLFEDRAGNLWIGTFGDGVNIMPAGSNRIIAYSNRDKFSNDVILCFFQDREGTLWIGTNGGGLNSLRETKIKTYSRKNGLSYHNMYGVFEDSRGRIWTGTKGYGVNYFNGRKNRFLTMTSKDGMASDNIVSITEDRSGALWFGTLGGGVIRYDEGQFHRYSTRDGLAYDHTRAVYSDPGGDVWVGTITGIVHKYNPATHGFTPVADLKYRINTMLRDSAGSLWLGTLGRGLCRMKDKKIDVFDMEDGLSSNIISCVHEDEKENGVLWIGTVKGVNRYKDGKFQALYKKDGLPDNVSYWILEDHKHNFWISSNRGIYCLCRSEAESFWQSKTDRVIPISFGKESGMLSIECNGGNHPGGWKSHDGRLWFPTTNGISVIDPKKIGVNKIPPPVVIEKISLDGEIIPVGKNRKISVPPGKNNLEIHYTALSFVIPKNIRFKYKLEGYDTKWIDAGGLRTAVYTDVPPGTYFFQVIACNSDGVWNHTGATLKMELRPTFFQTLYFRLPVYTALAGVVIFLGFLSRVRLRKRKRKRQAVRCNGLDSDETERTIKKLLYLIEVEKIYKSSDITLRSLAGHLLVSPRYLSQIINDRLHVNFYEFINQHRVKEAQRLITVPGGRHKSILDIAYEVGYNSKSAFNRSFKNFTQMTPSQYRKKHKIKN